MVDWKTAVKSAIIRQSQKRKDGIFSRRNIIDEELAQIVSEVNSSGRTPEQTLSRELQELADVGFIRFFNNRGLYKLNSEYDDGKKDRIAAQYFIDGFRSLRSFDISFEHGLNALVGPNGSGKTTFLEFLDFLSTFITRDASTAVSLAGGVSRVFSLENSKKSSPALTARILGTADISGVWEDPNHRYLFSFEYYCEIRFSKSFLALYVSNERIKFYSLRNVSEPQFKNTLVGSINIRRRTPLADVDPSIAISPRLRTTGVRNPLRFFRRSAARPEKPRLWTEDFDLVNAIALEPDQSLLAERMLIPALDAVRSAVSRGRTFNLIPAEARQPDDLTRSPSIRYDGSGLSATLYHMQRLSRQKPTDHDHRYSRFEPTSFQTITDWTRLVLPELKEISVNSDPHSGKYIAWLSVDSGDKYIRFPLQFASDGTIKWLSFAAMIISRGGVYSLEEPENFLHPRMQQFLVELIRSRIEAEDNPSFYILSTHSETIINQLRPEELVIFSFSGGSTSAKRLDNAASLTKEINDTGFGLGYYYASNAIS